MPHPNWSYIPSKDKEVWWLFFAGLFGAAPAAALLPMAYIAFTAEQRANQPPFISGLFLALGCLLAVWACVCWIGAARRVKRIKHLVAAGVPVTATVDEMKFERAHHHRTIVAAVLKLHFELDGRKIDARKRTGMRGIIGPAREFKWVDLAVDPLAPTSFAFVVDGRLG